MNFEVKIGGKTCNFLGLYRSPSQNKAEFESFIKNLELNWNTLQTKAYNAKMQGWYQNDIATFEGCKTGMATPQSV